MAGAGLVWFFGYGSLMWNPGFVARACEPAQLDGWHRRFCITSRHYRGTAERPGLVLGLAPGGSCVGRAMGVRPEDAVAVLRYLDDREQVGGIYVYERRRLAVTLLRSGGEVEAWSYLPLADHPDYAGDLSPDEVCARVARAAGVAGSNRDYIMNTVGHLRLIGIVEPELDELAAALERCEPAGPSGTRELRTEPPSP